jgi:hypothetical protein
VATIKRGRISARGCIELELIDRCTESGVHRGELLLQPESTHLAIILNTLFKFNLSFSRALDLVHESESIEIVQYNIWILFVTFETNPLLSIGIKN